MYESIIEQIWETKEQLGYSVEDGCYSRRVEKFTKAFENEFGCPMPNDWARFLTFSNGLEFNGTVILGVDEDDWDEDENEIPFSVGGLLANNRSGINAHPSLDGLIILGWSELDLFAYRPDQDRYLVIDRGGYSLQDSYATFDELLYERLKPLVEIQD